MAQGTGVQRQTVRVGPGGDLGRGGRGKDANLGLGLEQQAQFGQCRFATA